MDSRFSRLARTCIVLTVAACLAGEEAAPPVIIQIRVVEGDGAVYPVGSRATRGLSVQVTDETSRPVDKAAVSFQLPSDGAGGAFASGGKTEIVTTKSDGMATVWGMQWNRTPGTFEIRVTASKGQARAGLVITQYLSDARQAGGEGTFTASHHSRNKWLVVAAVAAGVAAGVALRGSGSKSASSTAAATAPTQVGNPSIIVGHP